MSVPNKEKLDLLLNRDVILVVPLQKGGIKLITLGLLGKTATGYKVVPSFFAGTAVYFNLESVESVDNLSEVSCYRITLTGS